jgi:ABC-type arginine/histidine transport system permease subunit
MPASPKTYQPIMVFGIAGIIYYMLTLAISRIFGLLEKRFARYITHAR